MFVSARPAIPEAAISRNLHRVALRTLQKPAPSDEVTEDHDIPAVEQHDLEIAPPQRPAGPPAVLHDPFLADGVDLPPGDAARGASVARNYRRRLGGAKAGPAAGVRGHEASGNGASTARRSGMRESGSTSSTRSAASAPAACRAWRTASPSRERRALAAPPNAP